MGPVRIKEIATLQTTRPTQRLQPRTKTEQREATAYWPKGPEPQVLLKPARSCSYSRGRHNEMPAKEEEKNKQLNAEDRTEVSNKK